MGEKVTDCYREEKDSCGRMATRKMKSYWVANEIAKAARFSSFIANHEYYEPLMGFGSEPKASPWRRWRRPLWEGNQGC
jgi:hypothetical protein